jgi:hypothetical protein
MPAVKLPLATYNVAPGILCMKRLLETNGGQADYFFANLCSSR